MPLQGPAQGGYNGYYQQGYVQPPPQQQTYGMQYPSQSTVVVPQPPRHVVSQASPTGYQSTSPHPHQAQTPGYHPPPLQHTQNQYQQAYATHAHNAGFIARPQPQNLHAYQQNQQYYQPQQLQQPLGHGYYQSSPVQALQRLPDAPHPRQSQQIQASPRLPDPPLPQRRAPPAPTQRQAIGAPASSQPNRAQHTSPASRPVAVAATPQHRTVAHVQIPLQRASIAAPEVEMPRAAKRRRSNDGAAILVCDAPPPQRSSVPQRAKQEAVQPSPLTNSCTPNITPAPQPQVQPNVDYQSVLLSLADEYVAAAYDMSTPVGSSGMDDEQVEQYHTLISTALGCLESALQNYRHSEPRKEARIRLRLASLLHEETENSQQAEEILSKGIALCERSRLTDLKYAMQHLLVRIMSSGSPKAGVKAVEKVITEVETLKLVQWIYTFRILRVSLALQADGHADVAAVLKHLTTISNLAEDHRHTAVQIIAAVLETITHLRSGAADAVELAQRALAAARMHQLSPELQRLPQVRALLDCLDLACVLLQFRPDTIAEKMQHMHANMDAATRENAWSSQNGFLIPLGVAASEHIEGDTAGVLTRSAGGEAALVFDWVHKGQLYALGYLMSGVASAHKGGGDGKIERFLMEGLKLVKIIPEKVPQPLGSVVAQAQWQASMAITVRLQLALARCAHADWVSANETMQELRVSLPHQVETLSAFTHAIILYVDAVCKQGSGELEAAAALYAAPQLAFNKASKEVTPLRDLQILATLNRVLILRAQNGAPHAEAAELLSSIDVAASTHSNKAIIAACYLIKAMGSSGGAIIKVKQLLQTAVQAAKAVVNNQLLCVVMSMMTHLFFNGIVGDQAVKSARASRTLAKKTGNRLWEAVADRMYGDTLELCGAPDEAEIARDEARAAMLSLPQPLTERFMMD